MMMDANKLNEAPQYDYDKEKDVGIDTTEATFGEHPGIHRAEDVVKTNPLARTLQGRHMQMIAIGIRTRFAETELFLT
jgi:amino acid permease